MSLRLFELEVSWFVNLFQTLLLIIMKCIINNFKTIEIVIKVNYTESPFSLKKSPQNFEKDSGNKLNRACVTCITKPKRITKRLACMV